MTANTISNYNSHWSATIEGFQFSPIEFYKKIQEALETKAYPHTKVDDILLRESGLFSADRHYLEVSYKNLCFVVCASQFGKQDFFISWWLGSDENGIVRALCSIPFIGHFFQFLFGPDSLYNIDKEEMFLKSVHDIILRIIDTHMKMQALRPLEEHQRRPEMRNFFGKR